MPAQTVIKIRRDTSTNWSSVNPTLAAGEIAFETDTNKIKVGDGSTAWSSLDYASGAGTAAEIAADTTNFDGLLSGSDSTVQSALETLDGIEISAGVVTSDTPPSSPSEGDLWFDSVDGQMFVYYDSFWVEVVSNTEVQSYPGETSLSGTILTFAGERNTLIGIGEGYAMGNGAGDTNMAVPANCKLVMATLALDPTAASDTDITVEVQKNNVTQSGYDLTASGTMGTAVGNFYSSPLQFSAGDTLRWQGKSSTSSNASGSVVTWYLLVD